MDVETNNQVLDIQSKLLYKILPLLERHITEMNSTDTT